jgi:hypothetical protein
VAKEIHAFPSADEATPKQVRAVTIGFFVWIAFWVGLGTWVAIDVEVARLPGAVEILACALRVVARTLAAAAHLPLVGGAAGSAAAHIDYMLQSVSGELGNSRAGLQQLSVLLGLAIAGLPVIPYAVLFIRLRLERRREALALRTALRDPSRREIAIRYLAGRALTNLPYHELFERASARPIEPESLAEAELQRLGIVDDGQPNRQKMLGEGE